MIRKYVPGTKMPFGLNKEPFRMYEEMIVLTNGITLSQICTITSLEPFVIQNWVKRGYIPRPVNKKYYQRHLARILMINALKDSMRIEDIGELMVLINGDVEDESDDMIKESDLYNLFSRIIFDLDDIKDTDDIINKVLEKNQNQKLKEAIKVMVYAYFSGLAHNLSEECFKQLKESKK